MCAHSARLEWSCIDIGSKTLDMRRAALLVSLALAGPAFERPATGQVTASEDRPDELLRRAQALSDVRADDARAAVIAALAVETSDVPAELLIAIAWGESRFIGATVTGRACGVMQTIARSRRECELLAVPIVGFAAGAAELRTWLADRRVRGDLRLALLAMACGNSAFSGGCLKGRWPAWVLARARKLGYKQIENAFHTSKS